MSENDLWDKLIRTSTLSRGWHLVRADSANDFIYLQFYSDAFTTSLNQNFEELAHRLATNTYTPIYHEGEEPQISKLLVDSRLDDLDGLTKRIKKHRSSLTAPQREVYWNELDGIARKVPAKDRGRPLLPFSGRLATEFVGYLSG